MGEIWTPVATFLGGALSGFFAQLLKGRSEHRQANAEEESASTETMKALFATGQPLSRETGRYYVVRPGETFKSLEPADYGWLPYDGSEDIGFAVESPDEFRVVFQYNSAETVFRKMQKHPKDWLLLAMTGQLFTEFHP